jgi:hypothetical protein
VKITGMLFVRKCQREDARTPRSAYTAGQQVRRVRTAATSGGLGPSVSLSLALAPYGPSKPIRRFGTYPPG